MAKKDNQILKVFDKLKEGGSPRPNVKGAKKKKKLEEDELEDELALPNVPTTGSY